tara:strand:+ start:3141 stop:4325 length:1185 start_codon:yes stop_codon:yes gene_type:complete
MITVEQALSHILNLVDPLDMEMVSLDQAAGRILAKDAVACRDQPPFASSAMDGYAVKSEDMSDGAILNIIGESAAGSRFDGIVTSGSAVRIFTGAPVPEGADQILIQEDCTFLNKTIIVNKNLDTNYYIRPSGGDFKVGSIISAPLKLGPSEISLLASMNIPNITVYRKPVIALIATGDELVSVGETPNRDQIISSNNHGLKALIEAAGGIARLLPIARDTREELQTVLGLCIDVDMIVTLGGASVGDYDLVHSVAEDMGMNTSFYKVSMRPGKPLMAGKLNGIPIVGLPGNPVSALVCGTVFITPAINAMLGKHKGPTPTYNAILNTDLPKNGLRTHYMRAVTNLKDGDLMVSVFEYQDSSLLSILSKATALVIRPQNDSAKVKGDKVKIIPL